MHSQTFIFHLFFIPFVHILIW